MECRSDGKIITCTTCSTGEIHMLRLHKDGDELWSCFDCGHLWIRRLDADLLEV